MSRVPRNTLWMYKYHVKPVRQHFKKLFVLDFEATCEKDTLISPQEIIEFPCLVVNCASFDVEAKFHQYVKPKVHSISHFCTDLTGISTGDVENEPEFPEAYKRFNSWLQAQQQTVAAAEMTFVTCGNWDLKTMLPRQCAMYNLQIPQPMRRWINLKTAFYHATGYFPAGLLDMHKHLNIVMSGKLHSGIGMGNSWSILNIRLEDNEFMARVEFARVKQIPIRKRVCIQDVDDCHSIVRILSHLEKKGLIFTETDGL